MLPGALLLACAPPQPATPQARLEEQPSGAVTLLQAVSVVDSSVVWISGHGGTFARTTDGGRTWRTGVVPDAESLQFRDVHAADAATAWLLAAGPGELSRVYRTVDAGATWELQWVNEEPAGFYDCLDFWDERRGFLYGDAVDGSLRVLVTDDAGGSWRRLSGDALPAALPGEGGFAASGTCALTGRGGRAWIAAGNAERVRVFRSEDFGRTWLASDAPVVAGEGAGLTSISMVDERRGTAFGGDISGARPGDRVIRTEDGGRTWRALPAPPGETPIFGGAHVPEMLDVLVTVGPAGAYASWDGGSSWTLIDGRPWWGVGSGGETATWIAGPEGRVARLRLR